MYGRVINDLEIFSTRFYRAACNADAV